MLNIHVRLSRDLRNNDAELAGIVKTREQVIITNNGRSEVVDEVWRKLKDTYDL